MSRIRVIYRSGKLQVLDEETMKPITGVKHVSLYLTDRGITEVGLFFSDVSVSAVVDKPLPGVKHDAEGTE